MNSRWYLIWFGMLASLISPDDIALSKSYVACTADSERYKSRSAEIKTILAQDQKDRESDDVGIDVKERDRIRRMRIGEIFGEGCFKSAKDYANAALVFQHGDQPAHYYQAFVWANRAVELGDESASRLAALAIDRYLVKSGRKQLFGSQAFREGDNACWCLEQTQSDFPDSIRKKYMSTALKDQEDWVDGLNTAHGKCPKPSYCRAQLKPSPKGSVPGFW